jgi:DNA ligase-1
VAGMTIESASKSVKGYDLGQGKRTQFGIGDFLVGVYDHDTDSYKTIAKIGTGLTDEEWRKMKSLVDSSSLVAKPENYEVNKVMNVDVWARPNIVVEIHSDEITKSPMHTSGLALRFPRLMSWREKKPQEATSTIELLNMFKLQKKGGDS